MAKRLVIDATECTGCDSCALTCSFEHERAFSLEKACIWVEKDQERASFTPRVCVQCEEAPCIVACPVGALTRDERSGATVVDRDICNGCQICVSVCPFDGIGFDDSDGLPLICDLCGGEPACVRFCEFPLAIRF
jgi:carbon-monoxide dehydrogenase iron sulfur subunit